MSDTLLLGADENQRIDPATGRAYVAQQAPQAPSIEHASLSGPAPSFSHPMDRRGMMNTASSDGTPRQEAAIRPLSSEELLAKANEMLDNQRVQTQGVMSQGASTGARTDAGAPVPSWLTGYMGH
jgi:hypothetical protein